MNSGAPGPVFSRGSFIAFLFLAPIGILCVFAIIVILQYRQFQAMLSPSPDIPALDRTSHPEASCDSLVAVLAGFPTRPAGDSLHLTPGDLTLLLNASPAAREQHLRLAVEIQGDSVFVLHTTQSIDALQGRVAWIFKKLGRSGFLNARVEGRLRLENGRLDLDPDRGYLNNQKIPRSALVKRGGFSPVDFLQERGGYDTLVESLAKVALQKDGVWLIRK